MIQHETSVGLLNPVGDIGRLCRARGVTLVVDAVSALGAEEVDVMRDGIDICFSSANKCLHAVSGVSFLCVAPEVWPRIAGIAPRVYYLDLRALPAVPRRSWGRRRSRPAVSAFFALETALDELAEQGGVPARREHVPRAQPAHPARVHRPRASSRSPTPAANRTRSPRCGCPTF